MQKNIIVIIIIILIVTPLLEMNEVYGSSFNCWNCGAKNTRDSSIDCRVCGWDICKSCGACKSEGCSGFAARINSGEYKRISITERLISTVLNILIRIIGYYVLWAVFKGIFIGLGTISSIPGEYKRKVDIRRKQAEKEMQDKKDREEKEKKRLLELERELQYKKEQAEKELQYKKEQAQKKQLEKERYEILLNKLKSIKLDSVIIHKKLGKLTIIKIMENQIYTLDESGNQRRFPNNELVLNFIDDIQ